MLAYTSASIYKAKHTTWGGYEAYFESVLQNMRRTGKISANYPAKPGRNEMRVYRTFVNQWIADQKWSRVSPKQAKDNFPQHAAALIRRINSYEYRK